MCHKMFKCSLKKKTQKKYKEHTVKSTTPTPNSTAQPLPPIYSLQVAMLLLKSSLIYLNLKKIFLLHEITVL